MADVSSHHDIDMPKADRFAMAQRQMGSVAHAPQVLIVDDEPEIRHSVRVLLEDAGYAITEAPDGFAALEMLRASKIPHVVLLDLMMPRLDGHGVLGVVAGDRRLTERHRFIVMTAANRTLPLAFANLLTSLAIPVIGKPFDLDELLEAVRRAASDLPRS
ncbi:MAG: response regulator [Ktedonobacterales bacterium]|nr:response regulator [Ktedonobacterales bacterium]